MTEIHPADLAAGRLAHDKALDLEQRIDRLERAMAGLRGDVRGFATAIDEQLLTTPVRVPVDLVGVHDRITQLEQSLTEHAEAATHSHPDTLRVQLGQLREELLEAIRLLDEQRKQDAEYTDEQFEKISEWMQRFHGRLKDAGVG